MLLAPDLLWGLFSCLDQIFHDVLLSLLYGNGHSLFSDELWEIQSNNVATQGNEVMSHSYFNICEGQKFVFKASQENWILLCKGKKSRQIFLITSRHLFLLYRWICMVTSVKLARRKWVYNVSCAETLQCAWKAQFEFIYKWLNLIGGREGWWWVKSMLGCW